jgi:hypothetical protein
MQLQVGDRHADETGEWEVASPYTSNAGKTANVRVRKLANPMSPRSEVGARTSGPR